MRVLIMAGGTGGHIYPGLAVAKCLQEKNHQVDWLGTRQGLEAKLIPKIAIPLHYINIYGFRRRGIMQKIMTLPRLIYAVLQAIKIMRYIKPDVVLGLGGYVSGPGGVAAKLLQIPLVIHEQNSIAGLTNKILAKIAHKVCVGFPGALANAEVVGNPVRAELLQFAPPQQRFCRPKATLRLLILGGSRGAYSLNKILPEVVAKWMLQKQHPLEIWHQTGEAGYQETLLAYNKLSCGSCWRCQQFIEPIATAYAWADLVICRAGALTVAELSTVGLGSILIPYPYAVDDHQSHNAKFLVERKAALVLSENDLTVSNLYAMLNDASNNYYAMALAAFTRREFSSSDQLTNICVNASLNI